MMKQIKTMVFGLSGNPPTENHLLFIQHLLSLPGYDLVRVVLNTQSPLKSADEYLPAQARFELLKAMLEAAKVDFNRCILESLELERPPPSRMIDTLKALQMRAKAEGWVEEMTLVLGLDALSQFTNWYHWDSFGAFCKIKFYPREDEILSSEEAAERLKVLRKAGIEVEVVLRTHEVVPMRVGSATEARLHYALGKPGIPAGMTKEVDTLIREHGYYGA